MTPRRASILLLGFVLLSAAAQLAGLRVPVLKIPFLSAAWFGWLLLVAIAGLAVAWLRRPDNQWRFSPLTLKQWARFKAIRRGYLSFWILLLLVAVASLDSLLVGKRALAVHYEGEWRFPFVTAVIPGTEFGLEDEAEPDYRELKKQFAEEGEGNRVILPLVPYAPSLDAPQVVETLTTDAEGRVHRPGDKETFNGRAYSVFASKPEQKRQEWVFRKGLRSGEMLGWNKEGEQVERGQYQAGEQSEYTDYIEGKAAELEALAAPELFTVIYPPAPPSLSHRHFMGTTTIGNDVLAVLFGGWQQAIIASVVFVTFVFAMGVAVGGTLGYFGGLYDLLGQRVIEIWNSLPFLFIVMIVSSILQPSLLLLVSIIALFSWMGTTTYIRTAAYKEKARDYVASARLLGAGTGRIIFHHILPNSIAILVTLAPFLVASIISSIAALDFVNFGLPPDDPSWGRLLREGTENFNYPWIVTSAFGAMVLVLVLVTFVGEAVREAFDPKKFTTYE